MDSEIDSNLSNLPELPSTPAPGGVSTRDLVDMKSPLTLQEIGFLEHYFISPYSPQIEELSKDDAMILAGFGHLSKLQRNRIANKILGKYESQAGDVRKIFGDIGFGQTQIARGIKDKALNAVSEMVSLNALKLAAQCTRMVEEPATSHQGVNIIINCGTEPAGGPGAPARPVNVLVQGSDLPAKPLQITK